MTMNIINPYNIMTPAFIDKLLWKKERKNNNSWKHLTTVYRKIYDRKTFTRKVYRRIKMTSKHNPTKY